MTLKSFYGFKIGMGQLFDTVGKRVSPVTAVHIEPLVILSIMNKVPGGDVVLKLAALKPGVESSDVVGVAGLELKKKVKKIEHMKVSCDYANKHKIGDVLSIKDIDLSEGIFLSVSGKSRGLGFQGVMKRHGFAGGPGGHGSNFHRRPGTSGAIRSSGKIIKGRRMPGRMGYDKVTVKGLKLMKIDHEKNCFFIKGALPGKKNNVIFFKED